MPTGASPRREHEFKSLEQRFKKEGRYRGREEEVAARIVNKQRSQYGETREEKRKDKEGTSPDRLADQGLPEDDDRPSQEPAGWLVEKGLAENPDLRGQPQEPERIAATARCTIAVAARLH